MRIQTGANLATSYHLTSLDGECKRKLIEAIGSELRELQLKYAEIDKPPSWLKDSIVVMEEKLLVLESSLGV